MYVKYSDNFGKYSDDRVNTKRREDRKQIQTVGKLSVGYRQVTSFHDGRLKYNLPPGSWCPGIWYLPPGSWCPGIWYLLGHPRQSPLQVCFSEMRSCLVGWNTHCWIQDKSLSLTLWPFCSLIIRRLFGKLEYPSQIAFSPPHIKIVSLLYRGDIVESSHRTWKSAQSCLGDRCTSFSHYYCV